MMSQNVMNLVDSAMVGQLGSTQLAAVGLASFVNFVAAAIFMGLAAGVQAMVARRIGEGRIEQADAGKRLPGRSRFGRRPRRNRQGKRSLLRPQRNGAAARAIERDCRNGVLFEGERYFSAFLAGCYERRYVEVNQRRRPYSQRPRP